MLSAILDGEIRKRPKVFDVTSARDLNLVINGVRFCSAKTKEEDLVWEEFAAFTECVVTHYKGQHTTSWWGIIDANAMGDGVELFYELLDEYRKNKNLGNPQGSSPTTD